MRGVFIGSTVESSGHVASFGANGAKNPNLSLRRHALRNALIPVVTLVGLQAPLLIGGAVIMEQIFVIPGMGLLLLDAVNQRDYPIITGVFLIVGVAIIMAGILAVQLARSPGPRTA